MGSDFIGKIFSFILLPVYTRLLSPAEYGILSYTDSLKMFILSICTLSLNSYILRYYFLKNSKEEKDEMVNSIFSFLLLINFIIVLILIIFGNLFSNNEIAFYPYIFITLINVFFESASVYSACILSGG